LQFREFQPFARTLPAFNLNDVRKFDPGFHRQQLTDWVNRGYITQLANGYYLLVDTEVDEAYLYMLANKLYEPSYLSRESALAHYHIIPESTISVTSVSSRKTNHFESPLGRFIYHSIKPVLMFGYIVVIQNNKIKFKIARLEKAILDFLYRNSAIRSPEDLAELRWNREELSEHLDYQVMNTYMEIFENSALEFRIGLLMDYIDA
jgi:predicted transcriptional regulator of viral defense system